MAFHKGPFTFQILCVYILKPSVTPVLPVASVPTVMEVTLPASAQVASPLLGSESAEHTF